MSKEKGYVYILTNPSFKDNWVKIGRSSKPVDVRSKELDNTAVPLPFEIYATVKTSKYIELETQFHKILTNLADARIRKGREFFNITPQEAFEHLAGIANLLDDSEINSPENITKEEDINIDNQTKRKSFYKGKYIVKTNKIFYFYRETTDAQMKILNGNRFIVLKDSKIDSNIYSNMKVVKSLREKYKKYIKNNITLKDLEFDSPSTAGCFVGGGAVNGKYYWRTKEDKKLDDFIEYIK